MSKPRTATKATTKATASKDKAVFEKDEEEIALEKAVFGDLEGFETGLKQLDLDTYGLGDSESGEEDAPEGLGDLDTELQLDDDPTQMQDENLFYVDEGSSGSGSGSDEEMDSDHEKAAESDTDSDTDSNSSVSDAWIDSDDEKLQVSLVSSDRLKKLRTSMTESTVPGKEYSKRLRSRFQKLYPVPKWALPQKEQDDEKEQGDDSSSEAEDNDEDTDGNVIMAKDPLADLLKSKSSYVSEIPGKRRGGLLASGTIDIARLKDANVAQRSHSAIQSLEFHPTHPLLLSAGYDRTLRLYHIDGKTNPLATSLHVRQSPFQTARFHIDGRRVFGAGRRRYIYIWDIETGVTEKITRMYGHEDTQRSMEKFELSPCGRFIAMVGRSGWLNILSATTGQWITGAKVEGVIADIAWHNDGQKVTVANTSGEVWVWNATARSFEDRWTDEAGIGTTKISLGANDRYCAIGSHTGIVNIYDTQHKSIGMTLSSSEAPILKPVAVLDQLVTTISSIEFSHDGQLMAIGSRAKKDAFRLVHVPTFTVFKNWPTSSTPLGKVNSVAFSPGTEMLSVGNEAGMARLWSVTHYT